MRDAVVGALRQRFGEAWGRDDEANLRFGVDAEALVRGLEGLHLLGEPEYADGEVLLRLWVDRPVPDLMTADELAFAVFGRLAEEVFYAERAFESGGLRYPFVTGSPRRGHVGALVLTGPHAADFAERFRQRITGGTRFHA
jgi:hypothetical protein